MVHRVGIPQEQDRPSHLYDRSTIGCTNESWDTSAFSSRPIPGTEAQEGQGAIQAHSGKRVEQEYLLYQVYAAQGKAGTDHRIEDAKRPTVAR